MAGAATSGLFSMRQGFGPMARAAMGCAAVFAFLDGMVIAFDRSESAQRQMRPVTFEEAPQMGDKAAAQS
ncbi:hypothetical protein Tco_0447162, partial [Tanacetum coccineum]